MVDALVACQRSDGFWNVSLHDPSNFGGKEVTGTSLFVYGMAWGINHGVLDAGRYLPVIQKAWKGLVEDCRPSERIPGVCTGYRKGTERQPAGGL